MVKAIQCYEDAAGKLHKCPFDAHRADLALWFAQFDDINDASAKKLADRIAGSREETEALMQTLGEINETRPAPPEATSTYDDVVLGASR